MLSRAPFCDKVDEGAVTGILDVPITRREQHKPGDKYKLPDGSTQKYTYYSCDKGNLIKSSRAVKDLYVFLAIEGKPITEAELQPRQKQRIPDCQPFKVEDFGSYSYGTLCDNDYSLPRAELIGLFGDVAFHCAVAKGVPKATLAAPVDQYCRSVLDQIAN